MQETFYSKLFATLQAALGKLHVFIHVNSATYPRRTAHAVSLLLFLYFSNRY